VRPDELERQLRQRLDALGGACRAELLHVLMLPDFERADRVPGDADLRRTADRPGGRSDGAETVRLVSVTIPEPTGERYCMNSISLCLEPDDAERDGVVD